MPSKFLKAKDEPFPPTYKNDVLKYKLRCFSSSFPSIVANTAVIISFSITDYVRLLSVHVNK